MKIEGIPEGWELVRIGRRAIGEFIVSHKGEPKEVCDEEYCGLDCVIICKKPKQYREPVAEDLKDGSIDVECCTPDPEFGFEKWRTRRLICILPEGYKNRFVVDHPQNKGIVLRYKKARIECDGSRRAAVRHISIFQDGKQDLLELIELTPGQEIFQGDMFQIDGEWKKTGCIGQTYDPSISPDRRGMHQIHYRAKLLESRSIC